jgi:hypothetical protein
MAAIKFLRTIVTSSYGPVTDGQVVDVSEGDAVRYVKAGWAERAVPKPAKKAAAK